MLALVQSGGRYPTLFERHRVPTKQHLKSTSKIRNDLSPSDYQKALELQSKFEQFNRPSNAVNFDKEPDFISLIYNMEKDRIQELQARFETLNREKAMRVEEVKLSPQKKKTMFSMADLRKIRAEMAQNTLRREMSMMQRYSALQVYPSVESNLNDQTPNEYEDEVETSSTSTTSKDLSPESAFQRLSKNASGLHIWRVGSNSAVAVPRDQYGYFLKSECYLIFAASQYGQLIGPQTVSKEIKGRPEYHIHFWLGSFATPEKAGAAAYKAVELDSLLGVPVTLHREVETNESPRFKSYFLNEIRLLLDTSSNVIYSISEDTAKIYRVKGNRSPYVIQLPEINWKIFSSSDVFLIVVPSRIFIWAGRSADPTQRIHAINTAKKFKEELDTSTIVFVDDGYERTMPEEDRNIFEEYLSLDRRMVRTSEELTEDGITEIRQKFTLKLYQCCNHYGKYRVTEAKTGNLKQEDLNHNEVSIIDYGFCGVWIWVGKYVNDKEKMEAIRNARGFVKKKKYPHYTHVTRVIDGAEPHEFKALFPVWVDKKEAPAKNKVPVIRVCKFDAATMHDRPALAARSQLVDEGNGEMVMWRIKRYDAVEIPAERYGVFFTADCYVILYQYKSDSGIKWYIYYWMGHHSVTDDQSVGALKGIELDVSVAKSKAIHVYVWQGREPAHFLQLFKGRMRVFSGRGVDLDISGRNLVSPTHYLLLIQGSSSYNTRATQVPIKAQSLNSNYCFVLRKGNTHYIWSGNYSTGDNREMAKGFVGADFLLILEGSEPQEFWQAICGKHHYDSPKLPEHTDLCVCPRLFFCSFNVGPLRVEEYLNFTQKDLRPEKVCLLDVGHTIYLWVGTDSPCEQHRMSFENALEFLRTEPCPRDLKTPIIQVRQEYEPPTFIGFFEEWDPNFWKGAKNYEQLRFDAATRTSQMTQEISKISIGSDNSEFDKYHKYSINTLRGPVENLPQSVDPLKKELHLTYDDFVTLFSMEYKEFEKIPLWKQQEMKKTVGLF